MRDQIAKIAGSWLQLAGFRMDAVPFLLETEGITDLVDGDPHEWLRDPRLRRPPQRQAMLLGEVNAELKACPSASATRTATSSMQFAFLLNQHLWLSLAREAAEPLEGSDPARLPPPPDNAWATFLRNHDELSLDKPGPSARRFFGLRAGRVDAALRPRAGRRAAAMLGGDGPRLRMAWSLMLSLPAPR